MLGYCVCIIVWKSGLIELLPQAKYSDGRAGLSPSRELSFHKWQILANGRDPGRSICKQKNGNGLNCCFSAFVWSCSEEVIWLRLLGRDPARLLGRCLKYCEVPLTEKRLVEASYWCHIMIIDQRCAKKINYSLTCKCSSSSRIAATFPHLSQYIDATANNVATQLHQRE